MKTNYIKSDFHLINIDNDYLTFNNPRITHRYGGLVKNNKIGIKGDTCNKDFETCDYLSKLDWFIRTINSTLGNYKNYYHTDNTIIKFDTIEQSNKFFDNLYDVITSNEYDNLSTFLNGRSLPKGIIIMESKRKCKFFKVDSSFNVIDFEFTQDMYDKGYKHTVNDLYKYDFNTMTCEPNLECKTWVKSL